MSADKAGSGARASKTCPLCGSPLSVGERVRSIIYPGKGDTLAEIHGCPHCDGGGGKSSDKRIGAIAGTKRQRYCPVCKEVVPEGGYVIARFFRRPEKNHMHVLGCTRCRRTS